MLNIRVNLTIDLKKVMIVVSTLVLALHPLAIDPAQAADIKTFNSVTMHEEVISVGLTHVDVKTTKSGAQSALNSPFVKYYDAETLTFLKVYSEGMPIAQWKCLDAMWTHESHFNPKALNTGSKAYGIAQFLPTTWKNYNGTKTSVALSQIQYGLNYIKARYGNPCNAWKFWQKHYWY